MAVKHGTLLGVIRRKSSSKWNKNTKKNLGPLFKNNLRWRLRNNEELCELLGGHGMVNYIQKVTVSWSYAWYIWMMLKHQKSIEWKILWEKTCGKTESGGIERPEEVSRGQDYLEVTYWRGRGLMSAVPPLTISVSVVTRPGRLKSAFESLSLHRAFCSLFNYTHQHMNIYILFKKCKIYIKTFKMLLHVSFTRSSSGSIYCSLLKL